jgi:hypothetical protein
MMLYFVSCGRWGRRTKRETEMSMNNASSGLIQIHSAPKALTSHVEWAISGVLGAPFHFRWERQPISSETSCAEQGWEGPVGSAAKISSALFGWRDLRFEVSEYASADNDGALFMHTPSRGIHRVHVDATGSAYITQARLMHLFDESADSIAELRDAVARELGSEWDAELDVFRARVADHSVTWLNRVG